MPDETDHDLGLDLDNLEASAEAMKINGYDTNGVEIAKRWVDFSSEVMGVNIEQNLPILKTALRKLAHRAQVVYPELESGEPVQLELADIGDDWLPLPPDLGDVYVRLTGDFLFIGVDGPLATAAIMEPFLDVIGDALERRREANDAERP